MKSVLIGLIVFASNYGHAQIKYNDEEATPTTYSQECPRNRMCPDPATEIIALCTSSTHSGVVARFERESYGMQRWKILLPREGRIYFWHQKQPTGTFKNAEFLWRTSFRSSWQTGLSNYRVQASGRKLRIHGVVRQENVSRKFDYMFVCQ